MGTLDLADAVAILKEYYSGQRVRELMYKNSSFLAMLPKKHIEGKYYPLPFRYANPQGRSSTFIDAQTQKSASKYGQFQITTVRNYSLASIASETILASQSDKGAFVDAAKNEIDGALRSLKRSTEWSLWGTGDGVLGEVLTYAGTPGTVTLADVNDIVKFEVGMTIEIRDSANPATIRSLATGVTQGEIVTINRDSGTFGFSFASTGETVAVGDLIMVRGDYSNMLKGVPAWIPDVAPTGASPTFFGVNRSADATRLAGIRLNGANMPLEEAIVDGIRRMNRESASPDYLWLSYDKYAQLEKSMGARVRYETVTPPDMKGGQIAFESIVIAGPEGKVKVLADKDVPSNRGYFITLDSWQLCYLGQDVVWINDLDKLSMLREATADAFEIRCASYPQLACVAPGENGVLLL